MKRYGNLFAKICSLDNLIEAHRKARKGKTHYPEIIKIDKTPIAYMEQIQKLLETKTYKVSEYEIKTITDGVKERTLYKLPYFPDRIIQWAILLQTDRIFINSMIHQTCSSIQGRGGALASKLLDDYLEFYPYEYCLKFDIRKYYDNVSHSILKTLLRTKFKDKDLLWLFDTIIDSFPKSKGIPIGSYTSQFFANFYLSYFDHWIKETMKRKCYIRYMDDVVILGESSKELHELFKDCTKYLNEALELEIKDNWQVFPIASRGIDFVGFRHFKDYKLLRDRIASNYKDTMTRARELAKSDKLDDHTWRSVQSYKGWIQQCNAYRLNQKYYKPIEKELDDFYVKNIRSKKIVNNTP